MIKSADRVLSILELLANAGRPMTHVEIWRCTGIPKSSLTGLLRNLAARGYIAPDEEGGGFALGESAYLLAWRGALDRKIGVRAMPLLQTLTRETGESSALSLLREDMAERVCGVDSPRAKFFKMHTGVRAPLYATSSGKVFLAWMEPAEREAYLRRVPLLPVTERTLRSASALRRQLQVIKREGVAISMEEFTPGITGIAVPVLDACRSLLAALGLAIPSERFEAVRSRALTALNRCAAQIGPNLELEAAHTSSRV